MKSKNPLLFVVIAMALVAFAFRAHSAPANLILHAEVVKVSSVDASTFLNSPELQSAPAKVLALLHDWAAQRKATLIGNPSVKLSVGKGWARIDGKVVLQAMAADPNAEGFAMTIHVNYTGQKLDTTPRMKSGETIFVGSFDAPKASPDGQDAGTCLVFAHLQ